VQIVTERARRKAVRTSEPHMKYKITRVPDRLDLLKPGSGPERVEPGLAADICSPPGLMLYMERLNLKIHFSLDSY
jgi:hypothetical protein